MSFPADVEVNDVWVEVNVCHTFIGELTVTVENPVGTLVTLAGIRSSLTPR